MTLYVNVHYSPPLGSRTGGGLKARSALKLWDTITSTWGYKWHVYVIFIWKITRVKTVIGFVIRWQISNLIYLFVHIYPTQTLRTIDLELQPGWRRHCRRIILCPRNTFVLNMHAYKLMLIFIPSQRKNLLTPIRCNSDPFQEYLTNDKSLPNVCPYMALYWIDVLAIVPTLHHFYCLFSSIQWRWMTILRIQVLHTQRLLSKMSRPSKLSNWKLFCCGVLSPLNDFAFFTFLSWIIWWLYTKGFNYRQWQL